MASRFTELVVDCRDPVALARFWAAVLDYPWTDIHSDSDVEIGPAEPTFEAVRAAPRPPTLLFIAVPEAMKRPGFCRGSAG